MVTLYNICFDSRTVSGLNLPEDVIKETEATWRKVVAAVNSSHQSDSLESQFFPLFVDNVTSFQRLEGEKHFMGDVCQHIGFQIERAGFEPWPGSLCCVLGQDT